MEILNEELRTSYEMTLEFGLAAAESQVEELEATCPIHDVRLRDERARTINGWKQATTCPASDGTCAFDVTAPVLECDGPALYEGRETPTETINVVFN